MMMILTALRIPETGDFSVRQECGDEDFQTTLAIIRIMVRHASYIVSQLPAEVKIEKRGNKKEKFYENLPEKFATRDFVELAKSLGIAERTFYKYITAFCDKGLLLKPRANEYIKKADQ
jgi:predicted transcriptional regulator YheO